QVLQGRLDRIRDEQQRISDILSHAGVPDLHMIEAHYYLDTLRRDTEWIEHMIRRLEDGTLTWPKRARKRSHRHRPPMYNPRPRRAASRERARSSNPADEDQ